MSAAEELAERLWHDQALRPPRSFWADLDPAEQYVYRKKANQFIQQTALALLAINEGHG